MPAKHYTGVRVAAAVTRHGTIPNVIVNTGSAPREAKTRGRTSPGRPVRVLLAVGECDTDTRDLARQGVVMSPPPTHIKTLSQFK